MNVATKIDPSSNSLENLYANPERRFAPDLLKSLAARREAHFQMLALQNRNDLPPGFKKKLLEKEKSIYRAIIDPTGQNFDKLSEELASINDERSAHIADAITDRINEKAKFGARDTYVPLAPPTPQPIDHSFWWAQTQPLLGDGNTASFPDDGLHFHGGPKIDDYNAEQHTSFGATALFTLEPQRRPDTQTGWFTSSPHVELFGGITAYAPNYDWVQKHGIASCNLFLRQTIFQFGFGAAGPVNNIVAETKGNDPDWHFYLQDNGYSRFEPMPGFKLIPTVAFNQNQFAGNQVLYAEVEVRLDIYLKQTGALAWCDPEVLLRTFQWPLVGA